MEALKTILMLCGIPVALLVVAYLVFVLVAFVMSGPGALLLLIPLPRTWHLAEKFRNNWCDEKRCRHCKTSKKHRNWWVARAWWGWHLRWGSECRKGWENYLKSPAFAKTMQKHYRLKLLSKKDIELGRKMGILPSREEEIMNSGVFRSAASNPDE